MSLSSSAILSLPPATRALTALLVVCSTLLFLLRVSTDPRDIKGVFGASKDETVMFPWLVLLPGNVVWYPWTLLTSSFVENNLIEFIFSLLTLPLAGRYLERVWGQMEFLKFVVVVVVASNIVAVVVNVLESIVLGDKALFLYGMSYHGLMALQVAFLVAFTQLIPEHQVQMLGGLFKMRVKSLPMLYVTVSNVACLLGYQSPWILIQFGWLISWLYLRFVKVNENGEFRGDRSETFAFAAWFPPFAQKYVSKLSNFVFGLAIRFKVIAPWTDLESTGGGGGATTSGGYTAVPGGARAEAERRRALALKALDQRMAQSAAAVAAAAASQSQPASSPSSFMAAGPATASATGSPQPPASIPMQKLQGSTSSQGSAASAAAAGPPLAPHQTSASAAAPTTT